VPMAPRVLNPAARTRIGHPPPGARSDRNTVPSRSHGVRSHPSAAMKGQYAARGRRNAVRTGRLRRMRPSERGTDARVRRMKPSDRGTDVPVHPDPRRALGAGYPLLVLAAGLCIAEPWARFTPGSSGSVRHPLPGCRKNEKRVPDPGARAGNGSVRDLRRTRRSDRGGAVGRLSLLQHEGDASAAAPSARFASSSC
jgi:hypothetical protein